VISGVIDSNNLLIVLLSTLSKIFLAIGAGAIFQVIFVILKWVRDESDQKLSSFAVVSGFAVGMLVMYLTSILV